MRLGLFGGTFDPPHIGHLILAAEACYQLSLDRLLWVLTPDPPHKKDQPITPLASRIEMVQAAIGQDPDFELSTVDIDRQPPHYAVDTVRLVRSLFPGASLFYIMGGDSLHDLPAWHRPAEFLKAVDGLGVMRRPDDEVNLSELEEHFAGIGEIVHLIDAPLLEVSSSQIRERIRQNRPFRYYLPQAVYQYIRETGLYRVEGQKEAG